MYLPSVPHATFLYELVSEAVLIGPSSRSPLKLKVQQLESSVFQAKGGGGVGMLSVLQRPRHCITGFLIAVI